MKKSIQRNLLKIASILSIFTVLPTPIALADSVYDGIWEITSPRPSTLPYQRQYFSIVIKDDTIVVMDLNLIAFYQNPLKGTYFGSLSKNIKLIPIASLDNILSIPITFDPEITKIISLDYKKIEQQYAYPTNSFFPINRIEFTSQNVAYFGPSSKDYPTTDFLPPIALRKIF